MKYLICLFAIFPLIAQSDETKVTGFLAAEFRSFVSDAQFEDQFNGLQSSLVIQPEFRSQTENETERFSFIPFARLDSRDDQRNHADVREAYWQHSDDQWTLLVGVNRVFWGVAESNHLVDIINQTDLVEDIDGEDKLGQPMINLATQQTWGNISFFVMPWFRERTFPSEEGRLRSQIAVAHDATYESESGQHHVDLALRYSHYIGEWDFGMYYFKGTGREPRLLLNNNGSRLIPHYDQIKQVGTDIQFTYDAWLWKFEGIVRSQNAARFGAGVGGIEYTLYQIANSAADLGLVLEYMRDGRDADPTRSPPVVLDDDIFLATRLAMNNIQNSELLLGIIIDRNDRSQILSIEAKHRLDNHWNFELESRWFLNTKDNTALSPLKKDSFVVLRLARYF